MLHVRVVRTLGCDEANRPIVASTVTPVITHFADPGRKLSLSFSKVDGALANSDIKMEFYGDGRLKGVNATTTGQGETIIKAAIKLAEVALEEDRSPAETEAGCKLFKQHFKDKPLTLVFETRDDLSGASNGVAMPAEAQSAHHYELFRNLVGDTCLRFGNVSQPDAPVKLERNASYAMLAARQPAIAEVGVSVGPTGSCELSQIWAGLVPVAQRGTDYAIPIPEAAFFGKQAFATSFDEAGAITMLQYGKDAGGAGVIGVVQSAADALVNTASEQAAALKAEADLIAAQQRLVKCQTSPQNC